MGTQHVQITWEEFGAEHARRRARHALLLRACAAQGGWGQSAQAGVQGAGCAGFVRVRCGVRRET